MNLAEHSNKCSWSRNWYGYSTECGYSTKNSIRNFRYCPYCGKELHYGRKKYMSDYYQKRKSKFAEYYREYHKEHK